MKPSNPVYISVVCNEVYCSTLIYAEYIDGLAKYCGNSSVSHGVTTALC